MKYKLLFTFVLLLFFINNYSQEQILLTNDFGVNITYQLILEKEGKKRNTYLLIVKTKNTTEASLFYSVQLHKDDKKEWNLPVVPKEKSFTKIKVTNANSFFGSSKLLFGDITKHELKDFQTLLELKNDTVYIEKMRFKIKSNKTPIVSNTYLRRLKKIDQFEFKIGVNTLNGNYTSNCNDNVINLKFQQSKRQKDDIITEVINGTKFIWTRFNKTTFIRKDNPEYWLTYNQKDKIFSFSTPEGTVCNWHKEDITTNNQSLTSTKSK